MNASGVIQRTTIVMARARNGKLKGLAAQARKLELHRIREALRDIERKLGTWTI